MADVRPTNRPKKPRQKRANWTPEEAREMAVKGNNVKSIRAAERRRLLEIATNGGKLDLLFEAGLNGDAEAMAIAEKAIKIVGIHYDQSPDASQKVELSGKVDGTLELLLKDA